MLRERFARWRSRSKMLAVRRRWLTISVILFQAAWLNVIVPGHTRGAVQLPGATARCCCCDGGGTSDGGAPKRGTPVTPQQRTSNCAICFFCAHLSLPPAFVIDLSPLNMLLNLLQDRHADLCPRIVLVPFDSCGPPVLA
jgi:hypothetical protein